MHLKKDGFEFATIKKEETGLNYDVRLDSVGADRKESTVPQISIVIGSKIISISISEEPRVLCKYSCDVEEMINWIKTNRKVLLMHWNKELSDREVLSLLSSVQGFVGLFFFVDGVFMLEKCAVTQAEAYGDFMNYPYSHDEVWQKKYIKMYGVDFDYFPRGRIVYCKSNDTFLVYFDLCIGEKIEYISKLLGRSKIELHHDEHYQCHSCNKNYVL